MTTIGWSTVWGQKKKQLDEEERKARLTSTVRLNGIPDTRKAERRRVPSTRNRQEMLIKSPCFEGVVEVF